MSCPKLELRSVTPDCVVQASGQALGMLACWHPEPRASNGTFPEAQKTDLRLASTPCLRPTVWTDASQTLSIRH